MNTLELSLLVSVGMLLITLVVQVIHTDRRFGTKYALSARDHLPDDKPKIFADRIKRAVRNQVEGLAIWGPLVWLVVQADLSGQIVNIAAWSVLLSRVLYVPFYLTGTNVARTLSWLPSFAAYLTVTVLLFAQG